MWKRSVDAWVIRHVREARIAVAALGVVLVASAAFIVFGGSGGTTRLAQLPPTPPSPIASTPSTSISSSTPPSKHPSPSSSTTAAAVKLGCSSAAGQQAGGAVPVHICIPQIGVNADVMQLGLNSDRTIEVPPLNQVGLAGWYKYSPAPGVLGPSIILGHIDSAQYGKGVFFDLGRLHAGDTMSLTRADGMVATFKVDKVAEYPKSNFPTQTVYGNTSDAAIRLITCGGRFDPAARSYVDNIVAFGSLVSLKRA